MSERWFTTVGRGSSAADAFDDAWHAAVDEHGRWDTGTLADKHSWYVFETMPMRDDDARDAAERLRLDPVVRDKWGPVGALRLTEGRWLFFGWATTGLPADPDHALPWAA